MRNFALGFIVAALLFCAFPVYGAVSSFVGEKIEGEFPVVVNGVELQEKAIVVGGKSFTPNRSLADAVGYDVSFQDGKIFFTRKAGTELSVASNIEQEEKIVELNKLNIRKNLILERIQELRTMTTNIKEKIIPRYEAFRDSSPERYKADYQEKIDRMEADYNQYMQELTELEEQLRQTDSRIQQLEEETKEYQNRTP